jgi:hypothetical protein
MIELFDTFFHDLTTLGDSSRQQWDFYVKEHRKSSSPFGVKWAYFITNDSASRLAWEKVNLWCSQYATNFKGMCTGGEPVYIDPRFTYGGIRNRPGTYDIIKKQDFVVDLLVTMWRSRCVGGVEGLSQIMYRIYKHKDKKIIQKKLITWIRSKLPGINVDFLEDLGPAAYIKLLEPGWKCYDLKNAEKQTGLLMSFLPFAVDLSHPEFPAKLGASLYSGIGPTSQFNMILVCLIMVILINRFNLKITDLMIYSDNFAVRGDLLPDLPNYSAETRFAGFIVDKACFGPVSMVTDNPNHRINMPVGGRQTQSQGTQYVLRCLMSVVQSNLSGDTCSRFLNWIVDKKVMEDAEDYRHADMEYALLDKTDLHEPFIDAFSDASNFVKDRFNVQDTNPEKSHETTIY